MKKIIAVLLTLAVVSSIFCVSVFAGVVDKFFDTDIKIEFESEELEYNRSTKFVINYPESNGGNIVLNEVLYENLHVVLTKIYDTSEILDFSYFIDTTDTSYEGYLIPVKFGETQIVTEYAVFGYNNGVEVRLPGEDWTFSCTTDTITIEDLEIESGYYESSYENTFDVSSYYAQLQQGESSQVSVSSDDVQGDTDDKGGNKAGIVILIVVLVLAVLVVAFLAFRSYNIKKYRKRR